MNAKELLLECRAKHGWLSDYRLAKELKISTARISDYKSGKRNLDIYALVKIAETLGKDPIELIAQYESEHEKNAEKRDYWQGFILRAKQQVRRYTLALLCTLSLLSGLDSVTPTGVFSRSRKYA